MFVVKSVVNTFIKVLKTFTNTVITTIFGGAPKSPAVSIRIGINEISLKFQVILNTFRNIHKMVQRFNIKKIKFFRVFVREQINISLPVVNGEIERRSEAIR